MLLLLLLRILAVMAQGFAVKLKCFRSIFHHEKRVMSTKIFVILFPSSFSFVLSTFSICCCSCTYFVRIPNVILFENFVSSNFMCFCSCSWYSVSGTETHIHTHTKTFMTIDNRGAFKAFPMKLNGFR